MRHSGTASGTGYRLRITGRSGVMIWLVAFALVALVFYKLGSKSAVAPDAAVAPVLPNAAEAERKAMRARVDQLLERTTKLVELQKQQLTSALVPLQQEIERRKVAGAALVQASDSPNVNADDWVPLPDIETAIVTRVLDELREFAAGMARMVESAREDMPPLARDLAQTAHTGFCFVTSTIGEARNYVGALDRFAISDTLVELWATARRDFGHELPDAKWFGQKD
jgi:hypothetical protein